MFMLISFADGEAAFCAPQGRPYSGAHQRGSSAPETIYQPLG
jgi:hypothetical protein